MAISRTIFLLTKIEGKSLRLSPPPPPLPPPPLPLVASAVSAVLRRGNVVSPTTCSYVLYRRHVVFSSGARTLVVSSSITIESSCCEPLLVHIYIYLHTIYIYTHIPSPIKKMEHHMDNKSDMFIYSDILPYYVEYHGKKPFIRIMKYLNHRENCEFPEYELRQKRLETFIDKRSNDNSNEQQQELAIGNQSSQSWSDICPFIDGITMADAGFFRQASFDHQYSVCCFCCGITLHKWCEIDNPLWEHISKKPTCSYAFRMLLFEQQSQQIGVYAVSRYSLLSQDHPSISFGLKLLVSTKELTLSDYLDEQSKYCCERERLMSFFRHDKNLPDPKIMANVGFYYVGSKDVTRCFACGYTFANWSPASCPWVEHVNWSPYCPFVRGINSGNIPMKSSFNILNYVVNDDVDDVDDSAEDFGEIQPKLPDFASRRKRVRSFGIWHMAHQMADAGFFYTGSSDRVQCYMCGGSLNELYENNRTESPQQLHAFWFPQCVLSRRSHA